MDVLKLMRLPTGALMRSVIYGISALCSVEVRRKVYIIDEVHMLTAEAFNALLKTLEEPPPVLFILATTEPHKLPATITSRCQRLDFRLIDFNVIKKSVWPM